MKNLPKHLKLFIILFLVIGVLGGVGWFFSSQELTKANEAKRKVENDIRRVETSGIYPSKKNLEELQANLAKAEEVSALIVPELQKSSALFQGVEGQGKKGLSKDNWKKLLFEKRAEADAKARTKGTEFSENFLYGFERYQQDSPNANFTLELGRQMVGLFNLADILIESEVDKILSFKRVMVESGSGGGFGEEALKLSVLPGGKGLYRVYPFEIEFIASPASLAKVVNGIASSELIFLTRFVSLKNEKSNLPERKDVVKQDLSSGPNNEEKDEKLYLQIAGAEGVKTRMRVDMALWKGDAGIEELNAWESLTRDLRVLIRGKDLSKNVEKENGSRKKILPEQWVLIGVLVVVAIGLLVKSFLSHEAASSGPGSKRKAVEAWPAEKYEVLLADWNAPKANS